MWDADAAAVDKRQCRLSLRIARNGWLMMASFRSTLVSRSSECRRIIIELLFVVGAVAGGIIRCRAAGCPAFHMRELSDMVPPPKSGPMPASFPSSLVDPLGADNDDDDDVNAADGPCRLAMSVCKNCAFISLSSVTSTLFRVVEGGDSDRGATSRAAEVPLLVPLVMPPVLVEEA